MNDHRFQYNSIQEIKEKESELGVSLPFSDSIGILGEPLCLNGITIPNRLGTAPMEGSDGNPDGSPSDLTRTKYLRLAKGSWGLVWFEAVSIVQEGRASSRQLLINEGNLDSFKKLVHDIKKTCLKENGFEPFVVMQATHSGRYSCLENRPHPLVAYRNPFLEETRPVDDSCIVTDDCLKRLEGKFSEAAHLAKEAGFNAIDIKACHGYLLSELLSAFNRKGPYGGCFENRARLLMNAIMAAKSWEDKLFSVTSRIGIFDGFPYPFGFGANVNSYPEPSFEEPIRLVHELHDKLGIDMVNLTMGNPYVNHHVTRPYDHGTYRPAEHPFVGLNRMIQGIGQVKQAVPDMAIWASAPSYLRQFSVQYTAGAVGGHLCDGMLFGRMSLANPSFARDVFMNGMADKNRTCISCGRCAELLRAHVPSTCVLRRS